MASTCSVCERDFKTDKAMKKHFTREHNSHLLRFECEWCLKRYLSEANLVRHAKLKHPDIEINRPAYTVFNPSPRSLAEPPAKNKRVVVTEPAMVKFKCVPAPVVLSGPPVKMIKHQPAHLRPDSPAVTTTPITLSTPATPTEEDQPNITPRLRHASKRLESLEIYQTAGDRNLTDTYTDLQMSDDNTSRDESTDSGITAAVTRKYSHTPVYSGVTIPPNMPTFESLFEYDPTDLPIFSDLNRRSSTPTVGAIHNVDPVLDLSDIAPAASKPVTPCDSSTSRNESRTTDTGPNSLTSSSDKSLHYPAPYGGFKLPSSPSPSTSRASIPPLVEYSSASTSDCESEVSTDGPLTKDIAIPMVLDIIERLDKTKTGLVRDILNVMFQ